ncbi:hypothetical protein K469DRAFT_444419, partial [Zopfia rhizophila CBS 207.26]
LHALVQFCTHVWLSSFGEMERWRLEFLELIAKEFPTGEHKNWTTCKQLLPHIESLYKSSGQRIEKILGYQHRSILRSVNTLAVVLQYQGKYDEAERLNRRALEGYKKELGEQHPDTLRS